MERSNCGLGIFVPGGNTKWLYTVGEQEGLGLYAPYFSIIISYSYLFLRVLVSVYICCIF